MFLLYLLVAVFGEKVLAYFAVNRGQDFPITAELK